MKKKIIILVSIIAFLVLIGGGIAAYYLWYVPAQKKAEKEYRLKLVHYVENYYDLLEERNFTDAQKLLKEYRAFIRKKKKDKQLIFYSCIMENSMGNL